MDNTDIPCIDLRGLEQKHREKGHLATEEILKCDNNHCTVEDNNDHVTSKEEVPESEVVQETETESKPGCANDIQGYDLREGVYSQQTFELKNSIQVCDSEDSDSEEDQNEVYENLETGHTDISEIGTVNEKYITNKKSGLSLYTSCRDRKSVVDVYKRLAPSFYQLTHSGCLPVLVNQQGQIQVEQNTQLFYQVPHDEYCSLYSQLVNLFDCLNIIAAGSTSGVTTISFRPSEIQAAQRQLMLQVNRSDHGFLLLYNDPSLFHRQIALIFHHELSVPPEQNIVELKSPCQEIPSGEYNEDIEIIPKEHIERYQNDEDRSCAYCFREEKVRDAYCFKKGQHLTMPGRIHGRIYRHHAILVKAVLCSDQLVRLELIHFTKQDENIAIFKTNDKYNVSTTDLRIIHYVYQRYTPDEIIQRAESVLNDFNKGKFKNYNFFTKNCEDFAMWCVVGMKISLQMRKLRVFIENITQFIALIVYISFSDRTMLGITFEGETTIWILLLGFVVCFIYYLYLTIDLHRQYFTDNGICLPHLKWKSFQLWLDFVSWFVACIALGRISALA